jgi:hypothetical protein
MLEGRPARPPKRKTTEVTMANGNGTNKAAYATLIALSALCTLGAALTLMPNPGASWPNIWGYKSLCTMAPAATLWCSLLAGISCVVRARLVKKEKRGSVLGPLIVLALLLGLAVWGSAAWYAAKAPYLDRVSGASSAP